MSEVIVSEVTDDSFEAEVLKSPLPVLVDYWASTCVPCKAISGMLDEVAQAYQGRVKITKLNIEENPTVTAKLGIRGVPTLMVFKDGTVTATRLGGLSRSQLDAFLDKNV